MFFFFDKFKKNPKNLIVRKSLYFHERIFFLNFSSGEILLSIPIHIHIFFRIKYAMTQKHFQIMFSLNIFYFKTF